MNGSLGDCGCDVPGDSPDRTTTGCKLAAKSLFDDRIESVRRGFRQGYREGVLETLSQVQSRRPEDAELLVWIAKVRAKVEADDE